MIFYKKRSNLKKILNFISETKKKAPSLSFLKFFKFLFYFFLILLIGLYFTYLVLLPKFIDESKVEKFINLFLSKNTKILFEVDNLQISPNYKFDIALNADKIKLKYNKQHDFIVLTKPSIEISFLSLLFGNLDLNKIKSHDIVLNTNFSKANKYSCFDYINVSKILSNKYESKLKLRKLHFFSDNAIVNLYDENLSKNFYFKADKFKLNLNGKNKPFQIRTNGTLSSSVHKITDFNLNLEIAPKKTASESFWLKLSKCNYNPLVYADKLKFYSKTDINLNVFSIAKRQNIYGNVVLSDYSFNVGDVRLPKNNLELKFKGDNIVSNCDFKLIKNQFIKIKSKINISKNKHIEAQVKTNQINLSDFGLVLNSFLKICNFDFNIHDLAMFGTMNADLYLKSNFKTITSNGILYIDNAKLASSKIGLTIDKINSDINFENNKINIKNSYGYINDSKFDITGQINHDAGLSLSINSEPINLFKVVEFLKSLPIASKIVPVLNDCGFDSGIVKIVAQISGTVKNPIIKTNSKIQNVKLLLKKNNTYFESEEIHLASNPSKYKIEDISVLVINPKIKKDKNIFSSPKMILYIKENDISIEKSLLYFNDLRFVLNGLIKNYKTNPIIYLSLSSRVAQEIFGFKVINPEARANTNITIKGDKIFVNEFNLFEKDIKIATLSGELHNIYSKNISYYNFKVFILNSLKLFSKNLDNLYFDAVGDIALNGKIDKPILNGNFNLYNIKSDSLGLKIENALLNIKNSKAQISVVNGKYFDYSFDLFAQCNLFQEKLFFDFIKFSIPYFNAGVFKNKRLNKNDNFEFDINELNGEIKAFDIEDFSLNNLKFKGSLKKNILNISTFSSEVFNGSLSGTINADLKTKIIKAGIISKELDVSRLSNKINQFSLAATGKLNALLDIEFQDFNYDKILQTLDGYIRFSIADGELSHFAKLERFLQAGNILSQSILKLNLNSTLSTLTKQNTGSFKTIEGILRIRNSLIDIQSVRSIGSNMSLYLNGEYDVLRKYCDIKILGRIPTSIVSVMGVFGDFSTSKLVDKLSPEFKDAINSVAVSPFEKKFSSNIPQEDIDKIPQLYQAKPDVTTREFIVFIEGVVDSIDSIKYFKWNSK